MANTPNFGLYKPNRADTTVEVDTSLSTNFTLIDTEMKTRKDVTDSLTTRTTDVEGRLDTLVLNAGDSNAEIVEARGTFSALKDRLNDVDTDIAGVQLTKITANDGNVKSSVTLTSDDFYQKLLALGVGVHTFYCVGGAVNAPAKTIRGFAHITGVGPANGYVMAMDYTGVMYSNYVFNGVWTGWEVHVTDKAPSWANLTITNGGNGTTIPQYATIGKKVIFRGNLTVTTYGTQSFVMPATVRPSGNGVNPVAVNISAGRNGGVRAFVAANGSVTFFGTINNGDMIDLTGMYYYID